jgi:hypothetical protein
VQLGISSARPQVSSSAHSSTTRSVPQPTAEPVEVAGQRSPHFATPDAAMRYLVAAYNAHDVSSERHVTTPDSRIALESERQWVKTFAFHSCAKNPGGDYTCVFTMLERVKGVQAAPNTYDDFGSEVTDMNEITVLVAPAARPGWYMYFNFGCGG